MAKELTDLGINKIKAVSKRLEIRDGGAPRGTAFYLYVQPKAGQTHVAALSSLSQ